MPARAAAGPRKLEKISRLDRSARETERHDEGFILARRPSD
jgi:hypothetical protein